MGVGIIGVVHRVYRLGREIFPPDIENSLKHRVLMLAIALLRFPQIRRWYSIADNPWLTVAVERFPQINGAIYTRYLHQDWQMAKRLAAIDRHYRMLGGPTAVIARATVEEVELARFDAEYPGLRLILDKKQRFLHEGEIVLALCLANQDLYSLAFTLGSDDGHPVIMIGALQGAKLDGAKETYRKLTYALHGMRPRDLMLVALKMLSGQIGIRQIWAISSAHCYSETVRTDYDLIWREHAGQPLANGFFGIPAEVKYRAMSDIPSGRRGLYRRRYQMLDRIKAEMAAACTLAGMSGRGLPVTGSPAVLPDAMLTAH